MVGKTPSFLSNSLIEEEEEEEEVEEVTEEEEIVVDPNASATPTLKAEPTSKNLEIPNDQETLKLKVEETKDQPAKQAEEKQQPPLPPHEAAIQTEGVKPFVILPQADNVTTLSVGAYTGVTAAVSHYSKSLPFEFESVRVPAFGGWVDFNVDKLLFNIDFKYIPGRVQSSNGNLNVYGWKYGHLWGGLSSGYLYDKKHHVYFKLAIQYLPILFPTQVGVFQSTAAFERIPAFNVGLGYKTFLKVYDVPVQVQADLYNVQITDSSYDLKYGLAYSLKFTPYYMWGSLKLGVSYEYLGQILSLTELNTGENYPFKSRLSLHQLLFSLESKLF